MEDLEQEEDLRTPEFMERMDKLFRDHERAEKERMRKKRRREKLLVAMAVFAIVFSIIYVPARAGWGSRFFANVYDKYIVGSSVDVTLDAVGPEVNGEVVKQYPGIFVLTKLPEGYELSEKKGNLSNLQLTYSDGKNSIFFVQRKIKDILGDDEENEKFNVIEHNGVEYQYHWKKKNGIVERVLKWNSGDMSFILTAPFGKEELLEIAEHVEFVK